MTISYLKLYMIRSASLVLAPLLKKFPPSKLLMPCPMPPRILFKTFPGALGVAFVLSGSPWGSSGTAVMVVAVVIDVDALPSGVPTSASGSFGASLAVVWFLWPVSGIHSPVDLVSFQDIIMINYLPMVVHWLLSSPLAARIGADMRIRSWLSFLVSPTR